MDPYSCNKKMEVRTSDLMWGKPTDFFEDVREFEPRNVLEVQKGKEVVFSPKGNPKECSHANTLNLVHWDSFCSFVFYK